MVKKIKGTIRKSIFQNTNGISTVAVENLQIASELDQTKLFEFLQSNPSGLDEETIAQKKKQFGLNHIQREKIPTWYKQLFDAFINPFIGILVIIAIVSFIIDVWLATPEERDYKTLIVVSTMVLISVVLRFVQEYRSTVAAEKLKNLVTTTTTVIRKETGKQEINLEEIIPGDIIQLSAGDMIPADSRIIQSKDLFVNQSILTGESLPVEKTSVSITNSHYSKKE